MEKEIFFQSSLPRAGSTLLQNIMGQNPHFYVTPTSGILELLYSSRVTFSNSSEFKAQDSNIMKNAFKEYCYGGLQGYFNGITDKPYIMDKSRGWAIHYGFLNSFYPNPKIICMVRDLRSIYASMEKNFRKNPQFDSGLINWSQMKGTTTEKRVKIWSETPPIGLAIERLKQIFDEKISGKILFIRYEDLTTNPSVEMGRIYDYLEINHYNHDFNNVKQITQEDDDVYGIFGNHDIQEKVQFIDPNFNEILGEEVSNNIKKTYKWFFDKFNYK